MDDSAAPATAFVVLVPEAQALAGALRSRFDPSAAAGVPAHITVLYPFMRVELVTNEVLARAADAVVGLAAFDFGLATVERFPGVLYLAPRPADPFVSLTEVLVDAFPAYPPFGGIHDRIVPHLTVAQGDDDLLRQAEVELRAALREHGPVAARCRELCLLQQAGGRWCEWQRVTLPDPGNR